MSDYLHCFPLIHIIHGLSILRGLSDVTFRHVLALIDFPSHHFFCCSFRHKLLFVVKSIVLVWLELFMGRTRGG